MRFTPMQSASAFLGRSRRQRYEQIPTNENGSGNEQTRAAEAEAIHEDEENHNLLHTKLWTFQIKKHRRLATVLVTVLGLLIGAYLASLIYKSLPSTPCDTSRQGYKCIPKISQYWGQYAPYYSVPSPISPIIPAECTITFAQILSRHGARDPTLGKTLRYAALIASIHANATSYGKQTKFIKDYTYDLGADQLSLFGQQQMIFSGEKFYERYHELARNTKPFIRAAGQARVIESALNWTEGFHYSKLDDETSSTKHEIWPYEVLVIPESSTSNNTLDYTLCTNFLKGPFGGEAMGKWGNVFLPPITARLNSQLPGVHLTDADTISLMDLCPFHTVSAAQNGTPSPFCALFTEAEWKDYDYFQSIGKYYGFEWGNSPLGPTQGVGFTNELISRLTGKPVVDHTSTNATLDGNQETFPLTEGGKGLYADFSHDNDMITIFAALGLYNTTEPLSTETRWERGGKEMGDYAAAWTVPFAGRLYVEKMVCDDEGEGEGEELVRVLVNDRVLPLGTCGGDELGRCTVERFVESLGWARAGGAWGECFN